MTTATAHILSYALTFVGDGTEADFGIGTHMGIPPAIIVWRKNPGRPWFWDDKPYHDACDGRFKGWIMGERPNWEATSIVDAIDNSVPHTSAATLHNATVPDWRNSDRAFVARIPLPGIRDALFWAQKGASRQKGVDEVIVPRIFDVADRHITDYEARGFQ